MADTKKAGPTPGPWKIAEGRFNYHDEAERDAWGSIEGDECYLATVWADATRLRRDAEANARLIAAAPDLLEALTGLLADIEDYQTRNQLGGHDNHCQVMARAAIEKALGHD